MKYTKQKASAEAFSGVKIKESNYNIHSFHGRSLCTLWRRNDWIISAFRANMYLPKGKTKKTEESKMKELSKKKIREVAKEYGKDAGYLEDIVRDMEGDGIRVEKEDLIDMVVNGDC